MSDETSEPQDPIIHEETEDDQPETHEAPEAPEPEAPKKRGAPHVSVCIPVHEAGLPLLYRTLDGFRNQTEDRFEVVVALDGFEATKFEYEADFPLKVVESPRESPDIAHRNHARNCAWRAAEGRLVWFTACDFLVPDHLIDHIVKAERSIRRRGFIPIISMVMSRLKMSPEEWAAYDEPTYERAKNEVLSHVYAGFRGLATDPGEGPVSERKTIPEGVPCLDRRVVEALGGFDEFFIGWGGNGEEFSNRLEALDHAGLAEVHLLRSVHIIHQPHEKDPTASSKETRKRQRIREAKAKQLNAGLNKEWPGVVEKVRALMDDIGGRAWQRRQEIEPPPELIRLAPSILKMRRRRGVVAVIGQFADEVVAYFQSELNTPARRAEEIENLAGASALVAVNPSLGELLNCGRNMRPGSALVVFAKTKADEPSAPKPLIIQRALPGLSMRRHRDLNGERTTHFEGRLARRTAD